MTKDGHNYHHMVTVKHLKPQDLQLSLMQDMIPGKGVGSALAIAEELAG